jgi:tetratricopeptide (TPR) repeat protein
MASEPNTPGTKGRSDGKVAPSRPLQIFLLLALLVTGAAYIIGEWTKLTTDDATVALRHKLKRQVANQNKYLTETELGREAEAQKKYADAVLHYRRALLGEVTAEGRVNLGDALLKQGNPDMAFSQFKEALRVDPGAENVYLAWGQALTLEGKTDEAVQIYQDALHQNPKFAQVHYGFAQVLEQQQRAALATQHTAELAQQPQAAARSAAEAQLHGADAVKHYAAAEQFGLNIPEFWCSYGTLLNKQGKFPQAETCLNKAVLLRPTLGAAQFELAVAQDYEGKYADAIGHYESALVAIPDDPATLNNLGLLYATATNQEVRSSKMAVLLATRACEATTSQNPRYMDTLARAYAADGDFFQAIAWEEKAMHRAAQLDARELQREFQPRYNLFVQHKPE